MLPRPRPSLLLPLLALFLSLPALLPACKGPEADDNYALEAREESVKPGINDPFADPDVGQWVSRFEREDRELFAHRQEIVAAAEIRSGMEVADVGSGTGMLVPLLSQAVGHLGRVYAQDIVPEFLEHIRNRADEAGLENVETVLGTERTVELEPSSVDVILLCDTYHHFEYPRTTMASIRAALRRDGRLVVVDFERIPGESSEFIMNHVRAGKETVQAEIEAAGFAFVEERALLQENYFLVFRKEG